MRRVLLLVVLASSLVALAAPGALSARPAGTVTAANTLETGVLAEINKVRLEHGLVPLKSSAKLRKAADAHSGAMAAEGFFSHESRDGTAFWKRVQRFYRPARYGYWAVGENLLWSSPDTDPQQAVELWMQSPPHRKNLLTPRWREVGLSAVHASSAPGTYGGREVTILTADFGVRR